VTNTVVFKKLVAVIGSVFTVGEALSALESGEGVPQGH